MGYGRHETAGRGATRGARALDRADSDGDGSSSHTRRDGIQQLTALRRKRVKVMGSDG